MAVMAGRTWVLAKVHRDLRGRWRYHRRSVAVVPRRHPLERRPADRLPTAQVNPPVIRKGKRLDHPRTTVLRSSRNGPQRLAGEGIMPTPWARDAVTPGDSSWGVRALGRAPFKSPTAVTPNPSCDQHIRGRTGSEWRPF